MFGISSEYSDEIVQTKKIYQTYWPAGNSHHHILVGKHDD